MIVSNTLNLFEQRYSLLEPHFLKPSEILLVSVPLVLRLPRIFGQLVSAFCLADLLPTTLSRQYRFNTFFTHDFGVYLSLHPNTTLIINAIANENPSSGHMTAACQIDYY